MYGAIKDKLHSFIIISEDQMNDSSLQQTTDFLFLQENEEVFGYVSLKDLPLKDWNYSQIEWNELNSYAKPIENLGVYHTNNNISLPLLFQILGNAIVLVKDENDQFIGYIEREDMLVELFRKKNQNSDLLKLLLASIPMGMFVVNRERKIVNCNDTGLKMIRSDVNAVMGVDAEKIFSRQHIDTVFEKGETLLNQIHITEDMGVLVDYSPILENSGKTVEGIVIIVQDLPMVEEMAMEIEFVKDLNRDLNAILSTIYDEILVVNEKGELLRYSENYISDVWKVELGELVGKSLLELKEAGTFTPAVTREVMEKKKKVTIVQETVNGKKILSVGNPVFDEQGNLLRIVIASRDITENTKLKSELKETKEITRKYKQELDTLKNRTESDNRIIYGSPKIERIMAQIEKLAGFSSTVLIQGESGVGKELFAHEIHRKGNRSDKPFLTVNCGAIPENLLESELFGYVKGAFTGADPKGKEGYFQQANGGILFLDEIGEISLQLQVKLLRVLQENEVVPIGSTKPIPIDVQIISATNKNLEKMVEEGTFREDLFYRLHVFPLHIPPLRERPEDVSPLAYHFLQRLNKKYNKNYHLTPDALNLLEIYHWPGNIRELQNMIERLFITADDEAITAEVVSQFLRFDTTGKTKPMITAIMPLQQAHEYVEEQLITLAMKQYKTTTKAAKALGISQSAVSRKYNKILQRRGRV